MLTADTASKFDLVNGVLDHIMKRVGIPFGKGYWKEADTHPSFLPGQANAVMVRGKRAGVLGVLHPNVLKAYEVKVPVTAVELDMELLLSEFIGA